METFFCDQDYLAYLSLMVEWCGRHSVRVLAYCLMPNHVHLIVVPETAAGLCRAVGEAHRRHTRRVNSREGWRGHLWQSRFASYVMDDPHLIAATRYVERNPVKAGLVERGEEWPWSSAAGHVAGRGDAVAEGQWLADRIRGWVCSWGEYLRQGDAPDLAKRFRQLDSTGRPLGDKGFIERLSALLGRDLSPKKPGPKEKIKPKANN